MLERRDPGPWTLRAFGYRTRPGCPTLCDHWTTLGTRDREGTRMPSNNRDRRHLTAVTTKPRRRRTTKAVASAIADLNDDALLCRDFGHSWAPWQARYIAGRQWFEERLRCGRCGTERVRMLDRRGGQLSNRYEYPDGYLVHGLGRLTGADRDALRLAGLQTVLRMVDEESAATASKRVRGA